MSKSSPYLCSVCAWRPIDCTTTDVVRTWSSLRARRFGPQRVRGSSRRMRRCNIGFERNGWSTKNRNWIQHRTSHRPFLLLVYATICPARRLAIRAWEPDRLRIAFDFSAVTMDAGSTLIEEYVSYGFDTRLRYIPGRLLTMPLPEDGRGSFPAEAIDQDVYRAAST